jgi:hypothetical protein
VHGPLTSRGGEPSHSLAVLSHAGEASNREASTLSSDLVEVDPDGGVIAECELRDDVSQDRPARRAQRCPRRPGSRPARAAGAGPEEGARHGSRMRGLPRSPKPACLPEVVKQAGVGVATVPVQQQTDVEVAPARNPCLSCMHANESVRIHARSQRDRGDCAGPWRGGGASSLRRPKSRSRRPLSGWQQSGRPGELSVAEVC